MTRDTEQKRTSTISKDSNNMHLLNNEHYTKTISLETRYITA